MFHRVKSEVPEGDQQEDQAPKTGVYKREQPARAPYSALRDKPESYGKNSPATNEQEQKQEENTAAEEAQTEEIDESNTQNNPTETGYRRMTQQQSDSSSYSPRPSYGPSSSYIPPQAPESISAAGDRCLTIGRGINMSGEIESCDHLLVEGTVEAALKGAKALEVAESGVFYGTVEIEEATIAGRFEGDITVSGRLTLHASAVITGSIAYRELEVEAGAVIDGRMTPMKAAVDEKAVDKYRAGSEASAMAKTPAPRASKKQPASNNESGLFTKVNTQY